MYNLKNMSIAAMAASSIFAAHAFAPLSPHHMGASRSVGTVIGNSVETAFGPARAFRTPLHVSASMPEMEQAVNEIMQSTSEDTPKPVKKAPPKKQETHAKEGILSPMVLAVKALMDDTQFNKLRAKFISMHSDIIESFVVNNSDTEFGRAVLKRLFALADQDQNGSIEESELMQAFQVLGFDWLKEKQVRGILERADKNENGRLELEEWLAEAPKTLRTNLIKLAKKNGGELGLLV